MKTVFIILLSLISFCGLTQEDAFKYINLANDKVNTNPNKASEYIEKALDISFKNKNKRAEGYCYNTLGAINYKLSLFETSADYYFKSIDIFKSVLDDKGLYNSQKYLCQALEAQKAYSQSIKYYIIFLKKVEKESKDWEEAKTGLARTYYNNKEYTKSKKVYSELLDFYKKTSNENGIANVNNRIGELEFKRGNTEVALQNFQESNSIAQTNADFDVANSSYQNISNYYEEQAMPDEAIEIQQQAYAYNDEAGNKKGVQLNSRRIGEIQLFQNNNPEEAIPFLQNSINLSEELGEVEELGDLQKLLSEAYEQSGNYDSALVEYKKHLYLVDSIDNLRAKQELLALKQKNKLNKRIKELETNSLKTEEENKKRVAEHKAEKHKIASDAKARAERDKIIMYGLVVLTLILGVSAFFIYRSSKQKRRANQLLALQSLRSQMNPHFIFNSLNSVNSFIATNDERSANKYLSEFSRLMRSVMENSKHEFIPLSSELETLKLYLKLEHFRFQDKFDYEFNIADNIDIDSVEIPPMLVQPYIENSVWHGLRYKEDKGSLKVNFFLRDNYIVGVIEDDGIGRKKSSELKTKNQKNDKSTAMKNIQGRLDIINDIHKTNLKVDITDINDSGKTGTRVEILIPYNVNREEAA